MKALEERKKIKIKRRAKAKRRRRNQEKRGGRKNLKRVNLVMNVRDS